MTLQRLTNQECYLPRYSEYRYISQERMSALHFWYIENGLILDGRDTPLMQAVAERHSYG